MRGHDLRVFELAVSGPRSRSARGPTHDGLSGGWGSSARDRIPRPRAGLALRCLLLRLWSWLTWAAGRLARGRSPFAQAVAVPSAGRRGPWTRRSPSAFGCEGDALAIMAAPLGGGCTCLGRVDPPAPVVRPMVAAVVTGRVPTPVGKAQHV
jgi:hypothetical protein